MKQVIRRFVAYFILFLCGLVAVPALALPPEFQHRVVALLADSPWVVQGKVLEEKVHWNDTHTMIQTDYLVGVEERLRGNPPDVVTLTIPGGTIDEETHDVTGISPLRVGSRYLLFIEDTKGELLFPFAGGDEGAFLLVGDDGKAPPMFIPDNGHGDRSEAIPAEEFIVSIRRLIEEIESGSLEVPHRQRPTEEEMARLPEKVYDWGDDGVHKGDEAVFPEDMPADEPCALTPPDGPIPPPEEVGGEAVTSHEPREVGTSNGKWSAYLPTPLPVIWDPLPRSSSWSPRDQYMMSRWNEYNPRLFRVWANASSQWRYGNGRFEIAGFVSDSTMRRVFGRGWNSGTFAVTARRMSGQVVVEADILFNPAWKWTADPDRGTSVETDEVFFDRTMLHELGHALGFRHPWESHDVKYDTVMNYAPKPHRVAKLMADDTNVVAARYGKYLRRNYLLNAYITADDPSSRQARYYPSSPGVSALRMSGSFHPGPIQVENPGSLTLDQPEIVVGLVEKRYSWKGWVPLKTIRLKGVQLRPGWWIKVDPGVVHLPDSMPTGKYYLTFYLANRDSDMRDNVDWVSAKYALQVEPGCHVVGHGRTKWGDASSAMVKLKQKKGKKHGSRGRSIVAVTSADGNGNFEFRALPPGKYKVKVKSGKFRKKVKFVCPSSGGRIDLEMFLKKK